MLMLIATLFPLQMETSARDCASARQATGASADQDEADSHRESTTDLTGNEDVSEAERHKRLGKSVERDQAKLAQTREELDTQQTRFDRINTLNEKSGKWIADKRKHLEAMGGDDAADKAKKLATGIAVIEQPLALEKSQMDLRFNTDKMFKNQTRGSGAGK